MQGADRSSVKAGGLAGDSVGGGCVCIFFLFPVCFGGCCFKAGTFLTTATALMGKRSRSDREPAGGEL